MAKTCQNCDTINLQNATTCTHCGKNLDLPTQEITKATEPQERSTPIASESILVQAAEARDLSETSTNSVSNNTLTPPPMPDNQLAKAILVTLFCCLPFGICAIVEAAGVSTAYNMGDYDLANAKANKAKSFIKTSFWIGLIINFFILIVRMIGR